MSRVDPFIGKLWRQRRQLCFDVNPKSGRMNDRANQCNFASLDLRSEENTEELDGEWFCRHWWEELGCPPEGRFFLHLRRQFREKWRDGESFFSEQFFEINAQGEELHLKGSIWKETKGQETLESFIGLHPGDPLHEAASRYGAVVVDPQEPMRLEVLKIPKPWGYEGWYTGIEKRGVVCVHDDSGRTELPYTFSLFRDRILGGPEEKLILLKTLNPVPDEVIGDLYLEMHEEKWEVYVITALDPGAWPSGKGMIRAGLAPEIIKKYRAEHGEEWLKHCMGDFRSCIGVYEEIRRRIDDILDREKQKKDMLLDESISPDQIRELQACLTHELREEEKRLRSKVESFVGTVPVGIGDVVTFPALQMHSLQHGIRVIEFQTPHYERLILLCRHRTIEKTAVDPFFMKFQYSILEKIP